MLHLETIEPATLVLLKRLQALPVLAETRLVGGTALALQLGHRTSIDLDIFGKWDYSEDLAAALSRVGKVEKESESSSGKMAFFFIDDVKVDCVSYEEYKWLDPPVEETGVRLAGVRDIAAMKINAVTNRGTRKDFVDVMRYALGEDGRPVSIITFVLSMAASIVMISFAAVTIAALRVN